MPSKNNIAALKEPSPKPILPTNDKEPPAPLTGKGRAGRKPKPKGQKQSNKTTLSFNDAEWATVEKKAGLANKATVIHAHLKKTGFFD